MVSRRKQPLTQSKRHRASGIAKKKRNVGDYIAHNLGINKNQYGIIVPNIAAANNQMIMSNNDPLLRISNRNFNAINLPANTTRVARINHANGATRRSSPAATNRRKPYRKITIGNYSALQGRPFSFA